MLFPSAWLYYSYSPIHLFLFVFHSEFFPQNINDFILKYLYGSKIRIIQKRILKDVFPLRPILFPIPQSLLPHHPSTSHRYVVFRVHVSKNEQIHVYILISPSCHANIYFPFLPLIREMLRCSWVYLGISYISHFLSIGRDHVTNHQYDRSRNKGSAGGGYALENNECELPCPCYLPAEAGW